MLECTRVCGDNNGRDIEIASGLSWSGPRRGLSIAWYPMWIYLALLSGFPISRLASELMITNQWHGANIRMGETSARVQTWHFPRGIFCTNRVINFPCLGQTIRFQEVLVCWSEYEVCRSSTRLLLLTLVTCQSHAWGCWRHLFPGVKKINWMPFFSTLSQGTSPSHCPAIWDLQLCPDWNLPIMITPWAHR